MTKKLTKQECFAKAEAYLECADHLLMDWTDDPLERAAGKRISDTMRQRANKWWAKGRKR